MVSHYNRVTKLRLINIFVFENSAPSAPINVSAKSPVFSIISLTWMSPSSPNGIIRDYQITYFPANNISDITTLKTGNSALEFEITGLTAFKNYSISIQAITVELGESSFDITVRTNEGCKLTQLFNLTRHLNTMKMYLYFN